MPSINYTSYNNMTSDTMTKSLAGAGSNLTTSNLTSNLTSGLTGSSTSAAATLINNNDSNNSTSNNNNNNSKRLDPSSSDLLQQLLDDLKQIEDTVDSIEIPARGRCKVYMAKFGYDPFEQSPNENPEAELALNAGDYIMVFDDIDEDGYFIGELIDGRRGYVPSNYLDRLTGDDLLDFQANVLYKQANNNNNSSSLGQQQQQQSSSTNNLMQQHHLHGSNILGAGQQPGALLFGTSRYPSGVHLSSDGQQQHMFGIDSVVDHDVNSYPPEFYEAIIGDTLNHSSFQHLHLDPEDYHRMNDYVDLEDVDEIDDECLSDYERAEAEQMRRAVAPPQRLVLERQLNKSILISWLHPQAAKGTIVSYQIYVDGVMKSTVPSGDRTKALLEGVDSNVPHRISVRAIDLHGRHSNDAACTIVTGRQVPFAPACVKASHITSDSALISWLPCNSNFHHVVAVNSVEVQTVRPGVYKHLINGLSANTLYRVWVRAKPGKILSVDEKNPKKLESLSTYVDFKTMPKSLPDPPVNVQVEAGPQRRTLLVTWLPLTLNDFGVSNGCPITGYAVFAGHKKLADIDSPTGDHALLDVSDLESLHKKSVTVRTKSGENLSQDSMPCHIPDEYLKFTQPSKQAQHTYLEQAASVYGGQASSRSVYQQHQHQSMSSPMHNNHQRLSEQANNYLMQQGRMMHQSPHRQKGRLPGGAMSARHQHVTSRSGSAHYPGGSRQLSRSMQNLDSDLDSRRSSLVGCPMDTANLALQQDNPMINNNTNNNTSNYTCESYSEEEFEHSMRCRGLKGGQRGAAGSRGLAAQQRFRGSRGDSHSLDGQSRSQAGYQSGSLAKLRASSRPDASQQQQHQLQAGLLGPGGVPIRFFVALFDYDPSVMSPNPNAAAEELAFKEGSVIKIFGDKGPDGFYQGELDGLVGFVPCNVVSEIRDAKLVLSLQEKHQLQQRQRHLAANNNNMTQQQARLNNQQQQMALDDMNKQQLPPGCKRVIALYDYDPQENSPNADTEIEIPFKQGDVIYIYGKMDTDGFFMGEVERTKQRGLVPSNFLREETNNNVNKQAPTLINKQQQQQHQMMMMTQQQQQRQQQLPNQQQQQQQMQPNQPGQQQFQTMQAPIRGPMNPMDAFQQQQQRPGPMQMQQQPGLRQMNPLANGQMQPNQLNARPNQMGQVQQQQPGNLINRPSSLSLMNAPGQQQPNNMQAQMMSNSAQGNVAPNMMQPQQQQMMMMMGQNQNQSNLAMNNNQQQLMMNNTNNANQQQHQQQQQTGAGGVLSNLLSSGKQIIGAATTPRGPPNQGPNNQMFQPGLNQGQAMMQQQTGINQGQPFQVNNQQQDLQMQQQQQHMMQQQPQMNLNDPMHGPTGMLGQQQQQHPMMNNMGGPMHQQQQHQGMAMPGQMGARGLMGGAGGPYSGTVGEEQGGNILNTVKNMFKL